METRFSFVIALAVGFLVVQPAEARILEKNAKVVAATPKKRFCNGPKCASKLKPLRIKKVAQKNNKVTDINAWRDAIGYVPGAFDVEQSRAIVPHVPTSYGLFRLSYTTVARVGAPVLGVYGTQPPEYKWVPGRFVVLHGASGQRLHTFDLDALLKPANIKEGEADFVRTYIQHAIYHEGVIYAAIAHATYASSTEGWNATLVAIRVATGEVIWQSQPLVANADRFLVVDDVIFAGYGFTGEPDYLYQINRHNGRVLAKQKLRSGPKDMYLDQYGQLHIRTYDTNYVFQVRPPR